MEDRSRSPSRADSLAAGFTLDGWTVHPQRNLITRNGDRHRVHGKFMDVLVCLAERDGVVSRQQLFDACW
ncbi:MAG: hypothetical protein AB1Z65_12535, partial [Candidatus Sulfomarinibacteraceae bacterium]